MASFDIAVGFTLSQEGDTNGSPHNDPDDPGGSTRWGISQRYHQDVDVLRLTREQAIEIYRREYWNPNCQELPWPISALHFDTCVNPGVAHARRFLEVAKSPADYSMRRVAWYVRNVRGHPEKGKYLKGWVNRCVDLYDKFLA